MVNWGYHLAPFSDQRPNAWNMPDFMSQIGNTQGMFFSSDALSKLG